MKLFSSLSMIAILATNFHLYTSSFNTLRETTYDMHHGHRLELPQIMEQKSTQEVDAMECVFSCTSADWCRSINFKTTPSLENGLHVCELLPSGRFTNGTTIKQDSSFSHYSKKNKCIQDNPCRNEAQCIYYEEVHDYRCVCKQGTIGQHCENIISPGPCDSPEALGMQSKAIPDVRVTASSYYLHYKPGLARLNLNLSGWACDQGVDSWIQVDLNDLGTVTAVATQGRNDHSNWVKTYSLKYAGFAGSLFQDYENGKLFNGNTDQLTVVKNDLNPNVIARFIRLYPKTWNGFMQLRMELYGCMR